MCFVVYLKLCIFLKNVFNEKVLSFNCLKNECAITEQMNMSRRG